MAAWALAAAAAAGGEPSWPGERWERRAPGDVKLDEEKLRAFAGRLGGRGCVVRQGVLAFEWGDAAKRGDVASAVKPWFTHFLLAAVQSGKLRSVDDLVSEREPALQRLNAELGHKDAGIRWRDLANQTSGYGVREAPGEAFDYSDFNMALFSDTLFGGLYGAGWEQVDAALLAPLAVGILQCEDAPTFLAFGKGHRPGRLAISPRDFARFGLLYLRRGRWRDRQVLREDLVELALRSPLPAKLPRTRAEEAAMLPGQRSLGGGNNQTDHLGSYSFAWWTNGLDREGRRHWEGVPDDAVGCFGHGGKRAMVLVPSLDLIVSWNDAAIDGREQETAALKLLVAAPRR